MKKRNQADLDAADLDELIEEITVDANGEDEQFWAFRQAIEDGIAVPCDGQRWRTESQSGECMKRAPKRRFCAFGQRDLEFVHTLLQTASMGAHLHNEHPLRRVETH
jgi:hypothetical protein